MKISWTSPLRSDATVDHFQFNYIVRFLHSVGENETEVRFLAESGTTRSKETAVSFCIFDHTWEMSAFQKSISVKRQHDPYVDNNKVTNQADRTA